MTEIYVDRAIDFIRRNQEMPFYLHVWLNDVHDRFFPKPELLEKFARFASNPYRQQYFAVIDEMDRQLGRLFGEVDVLRLPVFVTFECQFLEGPDGLSGAGPGRIS